MPVDVTPILVADQQLQAVNDRNRSWAMQQRMLRASQLGALAGVGVGAGVFAATENPMAAGMAGQGTAMLVTPAAGGQAPGAGDIGQLGLNAYMAQQAAQKQQAQKGIGAGMIESYPQPQPVSPAQSGASLESLVPGAYSAPDQAPLSPVPAGPQPFAQGPYGNLAQASTPQVLPQDARVASAMEKLKAAVATGQIAPSEVAQVLQAINPMSSFQKLGAGESLVGINPRGGPSGGASVSTVAQMPSFQKLGPAESLVAVHPQGGGGGEPSVSTVAQGARDQTYNVVADNPDGKYGPNEVPQSALGGRIPAGAIVTTKATGGLSVDFNPSTTDRQATAQLGQYNQQTQTYQSLIPYASNIKRIASMPNPTPADDYSLMYNVQKMLDPTAVVPPDLKTAQAQGPGSLDQRFANYWSHITQGTMTPQLRHDLADVGAAHYEANEQVYQNTRKNYAQIAKDKGWNADDIAPRKDIDGLQARDIQRAVDTMHGSPKARTPAPPPSPELVKSANAKLNANARIARAPEATARTTSYQNMTDDELHVVSIKYDSLNPAQKLAVQTELKRRGYLR